MNGGFGLSTQFSMGGGVRSGGRPRRRGASAMAASAAGQAEDAASRAGRGGDAYRQAAAAPQQGPSPEEIANQDPYAKFAESQAGGDDKPGRLPGGTMGTKPDFSEAMRIRGEYKQRLERRSPFMAMFQGVPNYHRAQDQSYQTRIQMAEEEAIRDWQDALRAAEAEKAKNTWTPAEGGVLADGSRIVRNAATGEEKPWEITHPEGPIGPWAPEENPYAPSRKERVLLPQARERNEIGAQGIAGDARELEKVGVQHKNRLAETEAEAAFRRSLQDREHGQRLSLETHKAGLKPGPTEREPSAGTVDPMAVRRQALSELEKRRDWDVMSPEEQDRALEARVAKLSEGTALRGRVGGIDKTAGGTAGNPAPRPKKAPPKKGDVVGGYKFLGGDPASQKSWEKVR
jgi:hypothetical protein